MQFVYCDAALATNQGHFANNCRSMVRGLQAHGVRPAVLAHQQIEPGLAAELGAIGHFRVHPNASFSQDPLCGWMVSFFATVQATLEDLSRINGLGPDDIVYYDSAKAAQLMALAEWTRRSFTPGRCPRIVVTFVWFPGVTRTAAPDGSWQWSVHDMTSVLYRYAGLQIPAEHAERFRLAGLDPSAAEVYSFLTGRQAVALPNPTGAPEGVVPRRRKSPPVIAFLGEQRYNKGLQLIPAIVKTLLKARGEKRIVFHNSYTGDSTEVSELSALAARDTRLEVLVRTLDGGEWSQLLDRVDMIVLPYDPTSYACMTSGIALEAIARGIPLVVPRATGIERTFLDYGSPGTVFESPDAAGVAEAVAACTKQFDAIADRAVEAGRAWATRNGAPNLAAAVLGLR